MMMMIQERPYMRQTRSSKRSELRTLTTHNWIFISLSKRSSSSYATQVSQVLSAETVLPYLVIMTGLQSNSVASGKTT
jgi:hypothetical protein